MDKSYAAAKEQIAREMARKARRLERCFYVVNARGKRIRK